MVIMLTTVRTDRDIERERSQGLQSRSPMSQKDIRNSLPFYLWSCLLYFSFAFIADVGRKI